MDTGLRGKVETFEAEASVATGVYQMGAFSGVLYHLSCQGFVQ